MIAFTLAAWLPPITSRSLTAVVTWISTVPPKEPVGFAHVTAYMFFSAPTAPVQDVPAGMLATKGKSWLAALLSRSCLGRS